MKAILVLILLISSALGAGTFNGTNQSLAVSGSWGLSLSMACWVYSTSQTVGQDVLVVKESSFNNNFGGVGLGGATGGDPVQGFFDGAGAGAVVFTTSTGYTANAWQHVAVVLTSATSRTVYLNGGNSGSDSTSRSWTSLPDIFTMGSFGSATPTFVGRMAAVALWNTPLSAADVASLAKGFSPRKVRPQNLIFYAPLIRVFRDIRGAVTITNNNAVGVGDSPPIRGGM